MSQWTERIRSHEVWKQLEALGPAVDVAMAREGVSPQAIVALNRIKTVLTYCGKRLAAVDPDLVQTPPLDSLNSSLVAIINEVQLFTGDTDESHLANANKHADNAVSAFVSLPFPCPPDDLTAISEVSASYRSALERYLSQADVSTRQVLENVQNLLTRLNELNLSQNEIRGTIAEASSDLAVLRKAIEEQRNLISAALTEQQTAFTTAQAERSVTFTASEADRQKSFTAISAEQQKTFLSAETDRQNVNSAALTRQEEQFTAAQTTRQAEFSSTAAENQKLFTEAQAQRQEAYTAVIADYTKKLADQNIEFSNQRELAFKAYQAHIEELEGQYENQAKQILEKVTQHKEEVENLVGIIGNTGVASGYLIAANNAEKSKVTWQRITVGSLTILAFGAIYIFSKGAESWEALASRLLTSLPIIILAAYAATQADKHHEVEKRNRKLALELAAIGPYLASLPPEMQNQFRKEMGERSFGRHDETRKETEKSPATAIDLIDQLSKSDKAKEWAMSLIKAIRG